MIASQNGSIMIYIPLLYLYYDLEDVNPNDPYSLEDVSHQNGQRRSTPTKMQVKEGFQRLK